VRSSRDLAILVLAALLGACGTDSAARPEPPEDPCESSILRYENFGELFMLDWCRGCHSAGLVDGMRQGAPLESNFEDVDAIRELASMITLKATGAQPTMPPAAGPSAEERALLKEWLACGAP